MTATLASNAETSCRSAGRLHCALLKSRPARHVEGSARLCYQFCVDPAGSTTGFPDGHADEQRAREMARHDCVMIWLAIRSKTNCADFRWATRISQPTPNSFFRFCGAPVRTTDLQTERLLRLPMYRICGVARSATTRSGLSPRRALRKCGIGSRKRS